MLFYHILHKVPSFLEFIIAKSEYIFLPKLMRMLIMMISIIQSIIHSLGLFYRFSIISDEQLYLLLTIMLALTENNSFINRLFLMEATPLEFGFFTERSDPEKWSVGSMMIVCMIQILSSHIHKADVCE